MNNKIASSRREATYSLILDHAGEFVVIDGTHIAAWANTREEIDDGEVVPELGQTRGKFYGYKVYIVVDVAAELPVAITMETGSRNDLCGVRTAHRGVR